MRAAIALLLLAAGLILPQARAMGQTARESSAATILGDWHGTLSVGAGQEIPLALHVKGASGNWTASLDSPAQGAFGLAVSVAVQDAHVRFDMSTPRAAYVATLSQDGRTLTGTWQQGAASLPLTMSRGAATQPLPGHTPVSGASIPYRSEQVAYDNIAGNAHLTGTLTLPAGAGPFPAVLLISGSGLQDRDETVFGHKPFLVWADYLTRRGIAVLRVDDRQRGGSTGEVVTATTADFAGDALAGVTFLRARPEISGRVGLIGHSEGAIIAAMLAARDPTISFIVMLAGVGQPGEELLLQQKRLIETAAGAPQEAVDESVMAMRQLYDAIKVAPDQPAADRALRTAWNRIAHERALPDDSPPAEVMAIASPWMRWLLRFDPRDTLARVHCPVLAVAGSKDLQVPPAPNLGGIKAALQANGDATIVELPQLNHLLQTATTGRASEYSEIKETVAPIALQTVGDWIADRTRRHPI